MGKLEYLLDRQEVLDCLTRFSRGMDRFDRELFLSAFHDDATIAAGDFVGGPADLYAWASAMHEQGQVATHHNLLNHTCDIDGDVAHTETYYLFVGRNRDDSNWIAGGRYIDRLERRDGRWKIALRTNAIEWSGMVPTMPIPFADVPDIAVNGAPSRTKDDPSYRRPLDNKREMHPDPTPEQLAEWASRAVREHPLVWVHRSGRHSLVFGATASHIAGMDLDEGRGLLADLQRRATAPDRVFRHTWSVGDMVMWDNRGLVHRACPFDRSEPRRMHRTTLLGDEPIQ